MAGPLQNPIEEAVRVIDAATAAGLQLRLTGGVAIATISPSALQTPLRRLYNDIDFVARSRDQRAVEALFAALGYHAEDEFNALHGEHRLFFIDRENSREADVFVDKVDACHQLHLADRLDLATPTIPPADLLLSKLQVVETTPKDYTDAIAVLCDHEIVEEDGPVGISLARIEDVCCSDWGWWRTVTMVGASTLEMAEGLAGEGRIPPVAPTRLRRVLERLESAPKTRKWKLRARVGDRVRWHEEPEGLEHTYG
ncbi:MAG TPA: hypothetical protein VIJ21_12160 [Solirubrobacterales bacterium]